MAEEESVDNILAARMCLRSSLEKSKALATEIEKTGSRLKEMSRRLPSLEASVRPRHARKCTLAAVGQHIDRAVGPAVAVLKVFDAVHQLERSLWSDPSSDLSGNLSVVKRLEEALKFLADNCGLAIRWLEDTVEFLEENAVADDRYISNLNKSLKILKEMKATEESARVDGGLLSVAFFKLEQEFTRLLVENSLPLVRANISACSVEQASIAPSPLPVTVIQNLQAIVERLGANKRLKTCLSVYIDVRGSNARASLQALDLNYLKISITEFDSLLSVEGLIDKWGKHLEFAIKHLFGLEYELCSNVFEKTEQDARMRCFAQIGVKSGFSAFLQFGNNLTNCKKDPIKLLKLLDIFRALNNLRLDFNRLFGGKACIEIQTRTRDLIKKVVDGVCEIFWELTSQVESQRHSPPPPDGSVQKLVSFVTDYCNELLSESYWEILSQVLVIHQNWKNEEYDEGLLSDEIHNIMKAIELNLETWSKAYEDTILSYVFRMNNHWHFCQNLMGTKLGELMGNSWLRRNEQCMEYYASVYLRESWGRLPILLNRGDLVVSSGGGSIAAARNLIIKRLKAFNETFDDMCKKHTNWVLIDKSLREKICQMIVQIVVPAYSSFMQNCRPLIQRDANAAKSLKYTAQSLENMLSSLFQPKLGGYGSTKNSVLIDKIKNVLTNRLGSALTAA